MTGRERTYGYIAAAAEYQRLGAFDGAYNLIPRFELMADTRGDRADIPFASVAARRHADRARRSASPCRSTWPTPTTGPSAATAVMASVEKALAESPTVNLGFRFTAFSAGRKPSVLDIWKDDLELYSYVRIELSR